MNTGLQIQAEQDLLSHMEPQEPMRMQFNLGDIGITEFNILQNMQNEGYGISLILTSSDLTKGRIFSTQNWIDPNKLSKALSGPNNDEEASLPPSGWLVKTRSKKTGLEKFKIIIGDGNHRAGCELLKRQPIEIKIKDIWDEDSQGFWKGNLYPFNIITQKIRAEVPGIQYL